MPADLTSALLFLGALAIVLLAVLGWYRVVEPRGGESLAVVIAVLVVIFGVGIIASVVVPAVYAGIVEALTPSPASEPPARDLQRFESVEAFGIAIRTVVGGSESACEHDWTPCVRVEDSLDRVKERLDHTLELERIGDWFDDGWSPGTVRIPGTTQGVHRSVTRRYFAIGTGLAPIVLVEVLPDVTEVLYHARPRGR